MQAAPKSVIGIIRCVLLLLLLGARCSAQEPTPVEKEVIDLVYDSHLPEPKLFTVRIPDRRLEVFITLREIALDPKHSGQIKSTLVDADGAAAALIRLGFEDIMEKSVRRLLDDKDTFHKRFHGALHPMLIPHLAEGLYDSENFAAQWRGDVLTLSVPEYCAQLILKNLQLEMFSKAVREQARVASRLHDKELVMMMRRWWGENKAAFAARKFDQVKPPE